MNISKYDHEMWYGDKGKAQKMEKEDLKPYYYCNLNELNFNFGSNGLSSKFNLAEFKKYQFVEDPNYLKLFARSKNLQKLSMSNCGLNKSDADLLYLALDP